MRDGKKIRACCGSLGETVQITRLAESTFQIVACFSLLSEWYFRAYFHLLDVSHSFMQLSDTVLSCPIPSVKQLDILMAFMYQKNTT